MPNKQEPNRKIDDLAQSLEFIRANVSRKGFLGPTVRDNRWLPSVGMRAARAAGVIVDDLGKMRCPPGTPNANQFTDLQMSNCMIPSAETAANAAQEALRSAADVIDRAIAGVRGGSEADKLPKADHPTSSKIRAFNEKILSKAPSFGKRTNAHVKALNDDGRYRQLGEIKTFDQQREIRRRETKIALAEIRQQILSGGMDDRRNHIDSSFTPEVQEFILTHSDDEIIETIEATALKIAKGRKREASVWGKMEHLESVLTDGYRPMSDVAGGTVDASTKTLSGGRGKVEAEMGIPLDSGLRPIYGFSNYTFFDEKLAQTLAQRDEEAGSPRGMRKATHALSVDGTGATMNSQPNMFNGNGGGYGDMEFILHPEVADRTTMHFGDSLLDTGYSTHATQSTDEEFTESIIGQLDRSGVRDNINRMLRTHITGDFANWNRGAGSNPEGYNGNGSYTEAQILGGFGVDDIAVIRLDGNAMFPNYAHQFNPDGVSGESVIKAIEEDHLSTDQLIAAGFSEAEIQVAREIIANWAIKNNERNGYESGKKQPLASDINNITPLRDIVTARERTKVKAKINERAPLAEVRFGTFDGLDLEDPVTFGGTSGQRVEDIHAERLRQELLKQTKEKIEDALKPQIDDDEEGDIA